MNTQYVLANDIDLTFDDVVVSESESQSSVPENLRPTQAMQDKFTQNCIDLGILIKKSDWYRK